MQFIDMKEQKNFKTDTKLHVDWATFESAKFACKNWHYSHSVPAGKLVKVGVWENNIFKGVVIFARGANRFIGSPYGLKQDECCELARIALTKHYTPVTKIVSIALKMLKKKCAGIKLVVSYADMDEGHEGKIYQAGNWVYVGIKNAGSVKGWKIKGVYKHKKTWHSILGGGNDNITYIRQHIDSNAVEVRQKGKHKYLYALDEKIKPSIINLAVTFLPKVSAV